MPIIVSIQIGTPRRVIIDSKEVLTSIYKQPIEGNVMVTKTGLVGDEQGDLINHGGVDKALCVYSFDHYPYWENRLSKQLKPGAFGENITVSGLDEMSVCIGDIYQLGGAVIQVSQPRKPCYKVGHKFDVKKLPAFMVETGFTGFYVRVLDEGYVSPKDTIKLIKRHDMKLNIQAVNDVQYHDKGNKRKLEQVLKLKELSTAWREGFAKQMSQIEKQ